MAIDPNPTHKPHRVRPARHHAPAGTVNTSRAESGGQEYRPGEVAQTPSMRRRPVGRRTASPPRPDGGVGGAILAD